MDVSIKELDDLMKAGVENADEILALRADNAKLTAERDRLRAQVETLREALEVAADGRS